ncbi:TlpA family protein disulfide reductase [Microbulbifer hainanensis]|uniref:TlpA family protein disulfide reductase n=1 Tax=Microbulbifer hainanensis TaxID=2735675 RepID=UPI001866D1C1|nr:TlpA disulfide reductase family protein [Microbulbifer hainanensis]
MAAFLWLAVAISGCEQGGDGLTGIDGQRIDTEGKVLLVNYWAEWCKPCRKEIPELNHFDSANDNVRVIGINFDQLPAEKTATQAQKMDIRFPILAEEPAARWNQPRPTVLPTTFVIDRDGKWRKTLVGPQTEASLEAEIEALKAP